MDVKLEQIVAVVVRCFLIYLMLVVGFQYVMLIGTFMSQSSLSGAAFFLLASLAIYVVLIVAMYKAPTIARKIMPNADTAVVKMSISPQQMEVICLRVIGIWLAADSLAEFASLLFHVSGSDGRGSFVDLRLTEYGLRVLIGIALALGAQGLSNAIRKLRGRDQV